MTNIFSKAVTCAWCGTTSRQNALVSTNEAGGPDLDLRPPEMHRSTMRAWLQQCPGCGLVASELGDPPADAALVETAPYRAVLGDERFPELARRFLAFGLLVEGPDPGRAAYACVQAAWICDDAGQADLAAVCRARAIDRFERCRPFPDTLDGSASGAILVDALRRCGRFDEAARECAALLARPSVEGILLRQVLELQQRLIAAGDVAAHRTEEALGQGE